MVLRKIAGDYFARPATSDEPDDDEPGNDEDGDDEDGDEG
jgi:hypothetical protein